MMLSMLSSVAGGVGRGLFAGAFGTAVMTASSTIEMKLRGRKASSAPADAAEKVLGVEPKSESDEQRFSTLVHFGYGTGWGAVRGVLGAVGIDGVVATIIHFGLVWGAEQMMLPRLKVAPPVKEWGAQEIAIDGFHHLVYATATGVAFDLVEDNA